MVVGERVFMYGGRITVTSPSDESRVRHLRVNGVLFLFGVVGRLIYHSKTRYTLVGGFSTL